MSDFGYEDLADWIGDFIQGVGNLEARTVERYEGEEGIVSTAQVPDGFKPFETAVSHSNYNDGKWIIVEAYDNEGEAVIGHLNWQEMMVSDSLPDRIEEAINNPGSKAMKEMGAELAWDRVE